MVIEILGAGCSKCEQLAANAGEALKQTGINAEVNKVSRLNEIMKYNVMVTPALVVDGDVKSSGKVLSVEQIIKIITG
jgi:small redox-active disulfide protein 2